MDDNDCRLATTDDVNEEGRRMIDFCMQLVGGLARLELASHINDAAGISEARQYLFKAAAGPKSNATVLAALMLADAESLGNKKNKAERIDQYLQQVKA